MNMKRKLKEIRTDTWKTLNNLRSLQDTLMNQNKQFYDETEDSLAKSKMRTLTSLAEAATNPNKRHLDTTWDSIQESNDNLESFYSKCFDLW